MSKPGEGKTYYSAFAGLDFLRFLLSVLVIVFHYQHFYIAWGVKHADYVKRLPLHKYLSGIYEYGAFAVQAFWLISGIVFMTFYSEAIQRKTVTFYTYVVNRFSRLYPLHLLTLVLTGVLQYYYYHLYNGFFVYERNNVLHLILNLLFIQNWFGRESSFNGPSWSVSVEIFVYFLFFLLCYLKLSAGRLIQVLLVVFFLYCLHFNKGLTPFNACLFYFFSGCLLSGLNGVFYRKGLLYLFVMVVWLLLVWCPESVTGRFINHWLSYVPDEWNLMILFAAIILSFVFLFRSRLLSGINFSVYGDLTYSMYLIHFPLQISLFLLLKPTSSAVFDSPLLLVTFIALTIAAGYFIVNWFEKPVQRLIRKRLIRT